MVAGNKNDTVVFWGCFIALVTTAFGFVGRLFLINTWASEEWFNLDQAQAGRLAGIGIWPFAVSIIGFSLLIDRIGYKTAMFFAFCGHLIWSVMAVSTGRRSARWSAAIRAKFREISSSVRTPISSMWF